jgi:excisionase family DNA binding protein
VTEVRQLGSLDKERGATHVVGERLLTLAEAAAVLRLHPRTVRGYVARGELKGRLIGRRWRFRLADLERFFDQAPARWDFYREPDQERLLE